MNGHRFRKIVLVLLFSLLVGSVLLLAGSLPDLSLQPGEPLNLLDWILAQFPSRRLIQVPETSMEPGGTPFWDRLGDSLQGLIITIFWVTLAFSIIYAIVSPEFRRELVRMFMLVLTMLILLPYIARRMTEQVNPAEAEQGSAELQSGQVTFPQAPSFVEQPPEWLLTAAKGLLLLLLLVGIYLLWRYLRPRSDEQAVVARHIRRALTDLDSGSSLDDAVIACYRRMCREFQKTQNLQRPGDMTAREFEAHLARAGISDVHIQRLTRLFEVARYGAAPTSAALQQQARQNLQEILRVYGQ